MKLAIYRFYDGKWLETQKLNEKEIALVIDNEEKMIYLWEGKISSPKNQVLAKKILGEKRSQFPNFRFRFANADAPASILSEIEKITRDSDSVVRLRIKNAQNLDSSVKVFSYLNIILLLIVSGLLFGLIKHFPGNSETHVNPFVDIGTFSVYFSTLSWLLFVILSFTVFNSFLSYYLHQQNRMGFNLLVLLNIVVILFWFWPSQISVFQSDLVQNDLLISDIDFYGFLINSGMLMVICIIFIALGISNPTDQTEEDVESAFLLPKEEIKMTELITTQVKTQILRNPVDIAALQPKE